MNKLNFYRTAAIVLLIINLSVIGYFLFSSGDKYGHPNDRRHDFKHQVIKILKLDKEQEKLFSESAMNHNEMMMALDKKQSRILQEYFKGLNEGIEGTEKKDFISEYNELEAKKITGTYSHFEEVKSYLKPEQMGVYKEFVEKAVDRLLSKSSRPPPPPRRR